MEEQKIFKGRFCHEMLTEDELSILNLTPLKGEEVVCINKEGNTVSKLGDGETSFNDLPVWKGRDGKDGQDGLAGVNGSEGKSAYEIARSNGFVGTVDEWLKSLKGEKGDKGEVGEQGIRGKDGINGVDGKDGLDGKDAEIDYTALDNAINLQLDKKYGRFDEMPVDTSIYPDDFLFFIKE